MMNISPSLEMLDKLEPPNIPDGYGVSVAYYCLLDIIRSIHLVMMGPQATNDGQTGILYFILMNVRLNM